MKYRFTYDEQKVYNMYCIPTFGKNPFLGGEAVVDIPSHQPCSCFFITDIVVPAFRGRSSAFYDKNIEKLRARYLLGKEK